MRTFKLNRIFDESGVSGTGIVAEGVEFSDGKVVLRWVVGNHRSTVVWDNIESVEEIHGHGGKTKIIWDIPEGTSNIQWSDIPSYGDHMPLSQFIDTCTSRFFTDDDGFADLATAWACSNVEIFPSQVETFDFPDWVTYVVWYNK